MFGFDRVVLFLVVSKMANFFGKLRQKIFLALFRSRDVFVSAFLFELGSFGPLNIGLMKSFTQVLVFSIECLKNCSVSFILETARLDFALKFQEQFQTSFEYNRIVNLPN